MKLWFISSDWASVYISLAAFVLSLIAFAKTRTTVAVKFYDDARALADNEVFAITNDNRIISFPEGLVITLEITNPGSTDVSFFHFYAVDYEHDHQCRILLKSTFFMHEGSNEVSQVTGTNKSQRLNIPPDTSGVIPAHSYQRFDVVVSEIPSNARMIIVGLQTSQQNSYFRRARLLVKPSRHLVVGNTDRNFKEYNFGIKITDYRQLISAHTKLMKPVIAKVLANVEAYGTPFPTDRRM